MGPLFGDRARPGLTGVLLLVSLLATALLAHQAHSAFVYHRVFAERVLRDFAGLAAGEFVRRSTAHLGYDGYAPLLSATARRVGSEGPPAGLPAALAADPDARLRRVATLARRFFAARPREGALAFVPDRPTPETCAWLLEQLRRERPGGAAFAVAQGQGQDGPTSFVFTPLRERTDWELVGFEVELSRLGPWLAEAFEAGPLLPHAVGQGKVTNASLFVAVRDHGGVERFRAGRESRPRLGQELPFGAVYSGVLDGARVELSIDPEAAGRLVFGGLPRSRLPLLLGLLALSTGLVLTALLQLRRERALQRLRAEFVASVSHELRTPLAQIRMFAETLLLERVRSDEERRHALAVLDREARRLANLVDNVLQFSRLERGAAPLAPERRPLAPLVREVLEQFQPFLDAAGVRLRPSLDPAAEAPADPDALRQILLNLLDNAVKYGPRGQELTVGLERLGAGVRLSVQDEGPGIPAGERRRVFERFRRLERDRRSAVAGTGIGLAVVRELAERHGGRAFVEEAAPGAGARVVVELPA